MARRMIAAGMLAGLALAGTPALAQKLGQGGTGVDENTELPRCAAGVVFGYKQASSQAARDVSESMGSPGD